MNDTKIRVLASILHFEEFTVQELCDRAILSESQARPVFTSLLNREKFIRQKRLNASGARHRRRGVYEVIPERKQELVNQLYGLTRVLEGRSKEGERRHWASIGEDLDNITRFLNMTDRAIARAGLDRTEMEWVETQMKSMYSRLESATYDAGLDLREPSIQAHPLVGLWSRWKECAQKAHEVVYRWQSAAQIAAESFPAVHVNQPEKLEIVTDPSFIDSAIFMWIFSQQPFRAANMNVDCELIPTTWKDVPARVGQSASAIGFYNRRASDDFTFTEPAYWADLCVYSGYALLIHRDLAPVRRPETLQQAQKYIDEFILICTNSGRKPTITSFGEDTKWRLGTQLTEKTSSAIFRPNIIDNPEAAFQAFREDKFSLFVGGLPQRLRAEKEEHVPLLDARLKPEWTSVNGLIHTTSLMESGGAVLEKALSFWYKTIYQLKYDISYRKRAARMIRAMLQARFGQDKDFFQEWMLDRVFTSEDLEFFAARPADMTYRLVKKLEDDAAVRDTQREKDGKHGESEHKDASSMLQALPPVSPPADSRPN